MDLKVQTAESLHHSQTPGEFLLRHVSTKQYGSGR